MPQNTRPNDAAFPIIEEEFGLTKREYFAALAMQGILAWDSDKIDQMLSIQEVAVISVNHADELIKALNCIQSD